MSTLDYYSGDASQSIKKGSAMDDLEAQDGRKEGSFIAEAAAVSDASSDIRNRDDGVKRSGPLWTLMAKLSSYGVEERGVERILPHERTQAHAWECFTMWFAANCTVSTFSLGTLGASIWFMGLRDAILTIIFFNLLSTLPAALFSAWGPKTGLRQLASSRFAFGYWTVYIPTLLNILACIGWSTINSIVGAQSLKAVSINSSLPAMPIAAGIVIIAIITMVVSFTGYRIVHAYEKYSWIPVLIIFIIYAGFIGKHVETGAWGGSGELEASSVLSFGAAVAGFGLGWSSLAADYSCKLPENTSSLKVFLLTYAGMNIPCITIEILGAAAMSCFTAKPEWSDYYESEGIGGLLAGPLIERTGGFGRFLMIILALSIVANNIPNLYSLSLTFQVLGRWAQSIPRPFIVIVGTAIYIVLAIVGANSFESAFDTLLILLSYWLAIYSTIMIFEHYIFRKGSFGNWNYDDIDTPSKLPPGLAAFLALAIGWVGAILGMASVWYVGVLAKQIGNPMYGGDIGFILSAAFTALSYPPLRYAELRYFKR